VDHRHLGSAAPARLGKAEQGGKFQKSATATIDRSERWSRHNGTGATTCSCTGTTTGTAKRLLRSGEPCNHVHPFDVSLLTVRHEKPR
jgi:hypothetical protein